MKKIILSLIATAALFTGAKKTTHVFAHQAELLFQQQLFMPQNLRPLPFAMQ